MTDWTAVANMYRASTITGDDPPFREHVAALNKETTMKVQIIETMTDKIVREIPVPNQRRAEKVEDGILINLDHERFHTAFVEED